MNESSPMSILLCDFGKVTSPLNTENLPLRAVEIEPDGDRSITWGMRDILSSAHTEHVRSIRRNPQCSGEKPE